MVMVSGSYGGHENAFPRDVKQLAAILRPFPRIAKVLQSIPFNYCNPFPRLPIPVYT